MARKTAEQLAKETLKRLAAKRPKETGVYARSVDGETVLYEVTLVCSDGKKRVRRIRVEVKASNLVYLEVIKAARSEMEVEAQKAKDSKGAGVMGYLEEYAIAKNLRPKTIEKYRFALDGFSLDNDSNKKKVRAIMESNLKDGTKETRLKCVAAFFKWLGSKLPSMKNPVEGQKIPRGGARTRIPSEAEMEVLFDGVDSTGSPSDRLFVRLLVYTGARCSTIQALRPCDLDQNRRLNLYNVKKSRRYGIKIPVNDVGILTLWNEVTQGLARDALIFNEKHHARLKARMRRAFPKDANGETLSPHSLRHLKATQMSRDGVPPRLAAALLDVDPKIMLAVYTTVTQDDVDAVFSQSL